MVEANDLRKLVDDVARADAERPDVFHDVLSRGADLLGLDEQGERDAAEALGIPFPTFRRWRSGRTHPHPALVPAVYRWLRKRLEEAIEREVRT